MTIIILIVALSFYPLKPRLPRVLVFVACQPLERSSRWTVVEASWGKAGPCCCHATNFALPLIPALVLTNFVTIFSTCTVCTSTCTTLKKGLKLPPNNATNHGFWSWWSPYLQQAGKSSPHRLVSKCFSKKRFLVQKTGIGRHSIIRAARAPQTICWRKWAQVCPILESESGPSKNGQQLKKCQCYDILRAY